MPSCGFLAFEIDYPRMNGPYDDSNLLLELETLVQKAFTEDLAREDCTSAACIDPGRQARAEILLKQPGCIAGLRFLPLIFQLFDPSIVTRIFVADGQHCENRTPLAEAEGSAASLLGAERTALNLIQHLSGIATYTARCADAASGTKCQILDTRKTLPGMRLLQKYAVRMGGGTNHRMNLSDCILIKDNHLSLAKEAAPSALAHCIGAAKMRYPSHRIQTEIERLEDLETAIAAGADALLLDNMSRDEVAACVAANRGRAFLEASGGMTLETIGTYAKTGVDAISLGALTHSVSALDLSMKLY